MTVHNRLLAVVVAIGAAVALTVAGSAAMADNGKTNNVLRVRLIGYEEGPAVSTAASGQFRAVIDEKAQEIEYQLSYSGLEGSVTQSHIHIGLRAQNGGIMVFLCSNLGNGPVGTQACPDAPATITGTLRPGDIHRPGRPGHHDRRVRRTRRGDPGRRHVRQRAQHPLPHRGDQGTARSRPLTSRFSTESVAGRVPAYRTAGGTRGTKDCSRARPYRRATLCPTVAIWISSCVTFAWSARSRRRAA